MNKDTDILEVKAVINVSEINFTEFPKIPWRFSEDLLKTDLSEIWKEDLNTTRKKNERTPESP